MPEEQEKTEEEAQPGNEATSPDPQPAEAQEKIKKSDVPWQVVQTEEALPDGVQVIGFFQTGNLFVLVTGEGFYGEYDGTIQKLPVKLIDNS